MVKDRIRSRGKQRSVKKDKVRRVKRSRKSSMRSRRSARRSRKSSMRSNRRTRRSTRRSSRSMRGGAPDPLLDESRRLNPGRRTRLTPSNPALRTRSPSPSAPPPRITTEERMREMGLMTRGMNEQLSDLYKEMAPMIIESVNTRVKPLLQKIQQDPTSTAMLLAVVTGILGRLISGDLGDQWERNLIDYP
jgi:hypothetical protein